MTGTPANQPLDAKERAALYVHLRTFESDFDKSQSQVRAICSAWSTAVLAAIALIVTTAATPIVVAPNAELQPAGVIGSRIEILSYLRATVCLIGSGGVLAFWYIDQGVYQRLLHSVFAYGLDVERQNPELPQVRSRMYIANLDVTDGLSIFFRAQFWIFALLSLLIAGLSWHIGITPSSGGVWIIVVVHSACVIAFEFFLRQRWSSSLSERIRTYAGLEDHLKKLGG